MLIVRVAVLCSCVHVLMCAYDLFAFLCMCCRCVCSVHALVRFVFDLLCVVLWRGIVLYCCV